MARKKVVPVEDQEPNTEGFNLPETETVEETYEFPEGLSEHTEATLPADGVETPPESTDGEWKDVPPTETADIPPEGLCAAVRFCGSHKDASGYYRRLADFIAGRNLKIAGFSREITMIDYGITSDASQFVTEIQIPVQPV